MKHRIQILSALLVLAASTLAAHAQRSSKQFEPLKAKLEITTVHPGESTAVVEEGLYFRDSQGRVRIEQGNVVTIIDPVAGVSYRLETDKNIAHTRDLPKDGPPDGPMMGGMLPPPPPPPPRGGNGLAPPPPMPPPPAREPGRARLEPTDLGTREIEGFATKGKQLTHPLPPRPDGQGNEVTQTTQIWFSDQLKLPLLVETSNSDGFKQTRRFTQIERQATVDGSLFSVPAGYQIVNERPPRRP